MKAAEATLIDFKSLFEALPGLYLVLRPDLTIVAASNQYLQATMTRREEIVGRGLFEVFPDNPGDPSANGVSRLRASLDRVLELREPHAMEVQKYDIRRPESEGGQFEERFWSPLNSPVLAADGRLLYIVHRVEDVTDYMRYRQLFDANPTPLWVMDAETLAFLAVNRSAVEKYGYSREEFLAMTFHELSVGPAERAPSSGREALKQHRKKDGAIIQVEVTSHAMPFEGRRAQLVAASDVTEKLRIEAQLLRSQRMESIGTLAGGIAHDLNNVFAPILMAVPFLADNTSDPESLEALATLDVSAKRGAAIVRQLTTFAGGSRGERVAIQFRHLFEGTAQIVSKTFQKSIRMDVSIPRNLWLLMGDPAQLDQVMLNLCVNARDAMPNGGKLKVTAQNTTLDENYARMNLESKPGPYVEIEVMDTGTGIAPGIIDKIFDPFFTTKEIGKGTGLGLSTVRAIVKSHGGFINVYSEMGVGTRFKVYLPAGDSGEARIAETVPESMPSGNGELILVVDDEEPIREITTKTLESYQYRVVTAKNGAEAIACYAQHGQRIQAVLLDMMMPVMDGPTAIRALVAINPEVRIIAASGLIDRIDAASLPVRATLAKPYTAGRLLTVLKDVLNAAV